MAEFDIESIIKSGVEEALNNPAYGGKSILEWAAIGIKNGGGWISVKDRLPDHSCTVLAYHDYGGMQVLDYSMKHKLFNCYDWNKKAELDSIKIKSVTHWMPLPEPPKESDPHEML